MMKNLQKQEKFLLLCDRVMVGGLCAFIYFMPISIALIEWSTGVAQLFFLIKRSSIFSSQVKRGLQEGVKGVWTWGKVFWNSYKPAYTPLNVAIGGYIAANAISIIGSDFLGESLKAFFFKLIQGCFTYVVFVECMVTRKRIVSVLTAFCLSAMLMCANAFHQFAHLKGFVRGFEFHGDRIRSSFGYPNDFGAYLIVVILLTFSLIIYWVMRKQEITFLKAKNKFWFVVKEKMAPIWIIALFIFSLIALGITYSRGAWLACACGFITLVCLDKKRALLVFCILVAFGLIFKPMLMKHRNASFLSDDLKKFTYRMDQQTGFYNKFKIALFEFQSVDWNGRKSFWREAITMNQQSPFFGVGIGAYTKVGKKIFPDGSGYYPHNCFLHILAEVGILGLGTFLWVMVSAYRYFKHHVEDLKDPFYYFLSIGFFTGLVGFWIHCLFDTAMYSAQLGVFMWFILAFLMVALRPPPNESTQI